MNRSILFILLFHLMFGLQAQTVEGYAFESGNRGYLSQVRVDLCEKGSDIVLQTSFSDPDGYFYLNLPTSGDYVIKASRELFISREMDVDRSSINGDKIFLKLQLERAPGYQFEVTLAPKRTNVNIPVDAIKGARIEVYNNTTKESVLELIDYQYPEFKLNMTKGNHYTILVRKKGFLAKRMEAYVNVEDCILCFEGVGEVKPGVLDNLTEGNEMGVLLANVEMEPSNEGAKMTINNIYYDVGKATLRKRSRRELDNVITVLTDNPTLAVEIGSHTDSRGKTDYNQELSEARAQSVVDYLLQNGDIRRNRLFAKGYGESELLNRCTNGVKCTERLHQKNRRTEMKIIGKVAEARIKSLEEMKKEEEFERSIMELEGQEQIRAKDEEELRKVLKERQEKKDQGNRSSDEEELENVGAMLGEFDDAAQFAYEKEKLEKAAQRAKHKELLSLINNNKPVEPALNEKGDLLSGFTIVIKENFAGPIHPSNEIFSSHDIVYRYYEDYRTFLYSINIYVSKEAAEQSLNKIKDFYPNSYVVEFKNGHTVRSDFFKKQGEK